MFIEYLINILRYATKFLKYVEKYFFDKYIHSFHSLDLILTIVVPWVSF